MTMTEEAPQVGELQMERVYEVSITCSSCGGQNMSPNQQPFLWQFFRLVGTRRNVIPGWYCDIDCFRQR